jgi:hypothetical protein
MDQEQRRKRRRHLRPTDVLKEHFKSLHARPGSTSLTFSQEFRMLEERTLDPEYDVACSCAELEDNVPKNRYTNVLPRTCEYVACNQFSR